MGPMTLTEPELLALGCRLGAVLSVGDVVLLSGTLGAGKSTLARGILAGTGFAGEVASPSFPIMLTYEPPEARLAIAHCDFYRLDAPDEAAELGLDEWLTYGALIAEWPDKGPAWLAAEALSIHIEIASPSTRALTVSPAPAWKERWTQLHPSP